MRTNNLKRVMPLVLFLLTSMSALSCSSGGGGSSPAAAAAPPAGSVQLAGSVAPDPTDSTAAGHQSGATVYAIGQQSSAVTTDSNGDYTLYVNPQLSGTVLASPKLATSIKKVATGTTPLTYDIVVVNSDGTYGHTIQVQIVTDQTNTVPTIYINQTGSITGHAYLQGQTDNSGITVYIPGTSFSAITAADGSYTITGVPSGTYDFLRAEKFGTTYHYAILSGISVDSTQQATVADMTLQLSTGPFGGVLINNGAAFTTSPTTTLSIATSSDAVLMSVSDRSDFVGATWVPVQATAPFTFSSPYPAGGQTVNVYVKFAQDSGLTSEPITAAIYLDADPKAAMVSPVSVTMNTTPTLQWQYLPPMPGPQYHVQLAASTDTGFAGPLVDQSNLSSAQYPVPVTLGQGNYIWRVAIIYNGTQLNWGPAWAFQVNRNAGTPLTPTNLSLTNNTMPEFTWSPNVAASSYSLNLWSASTPTLTVSDITGSSYTLSFAQALAGTPSTQYSWTITPYDSLNSPGVQSGIMNFTLDTVPPSGSIAVNNNDPVTGVFTGTRNVTLNLSASDMDNVSGYYVSEGQFPSGPSDPGWVPISVPTYTITSAPTFTLSSWAGEHTVYAWYKDAVGNISSYATDTIDLINFTDNIITLDSGGIRWPSIAICAPYGHAFVVYMDTLNAWVKYTTNAAGSWAPPIYVDQNSVSITGANHSIACNSEFSGIHAALRDSSGGGTNLVYAFRGYQNGWPLDWSTTALDPVGGTNWTASIAVDASNNSYISYDHNGYLYFATDATPTNYWATQAVDTTPGVFAFNSSIVTDSTGTVHIIYHDHGNWTLKYATAPGLAYNSWTVSTIDSAPSTSVGMSGSLAIDSSDNLHTAYMDFTDHALKYATKPNGSSTWTTTPIDSTLLQSDIDYSYQNVSIATAGPNKVFIVYGTSSGLKLATNYFGTWAVGLIDPNALVSDVSIAIDTGTKTIHIVYNVGESLLKYAKGQYW